MTQTEIPTTDLETLIDTGLAAYCEPDPERRAELVAQIWAADGELLDPPLQGKGHAELAALADFVLGHFPEHVFRRTSAVDTHHRFARYNWELVGPDGAVAVAGTDFAEFTDDSKVQRVVGFFGPLT